MNKKISSLQFACLIFFPIISFYSGISSFNIINISSIDSYLSILIAYLFGIFLVGIFLVIFYYKKNYNIHEKNIFLFGKAIGLIINIVINICFFFIGTFLLFNVSNFIVSHFLNKSCLLLFMIFLGIIVVYNVYFGISNMICVSFLFFFIIIILTLFSYLGILPYFDVKNMQPFLEYGFHRVNVAGILLVFTNVVPIFLLLIVKHNEVFVDRFFNFKLFIFYTIGFLFIFLENLLATGALGIYLVKLYQVPIYVAIQKISLFHFVDRIENFIYIKWILSSVVLISFILYHIRNMVSDRNNNFSSFFIMGIMIFLSFLMFRNNIIFYYICFYIFPFVCFVLFICYVVSFFIILKKKIS